MYAPFVGGSFPQLASNLISLLCQTLAIGMSTKVTFDWENVSKYKSKTVYSKEWKINNWKIIRQNCSVAVGNFNSCQNKPIKQWWHHGKTRKPNGVNWWGSWDILSSFDISESIYAVPVSLNS